MQCDICHEREAVIFIDQRSKNGEHRKISICQECAVTYGVGSDPASIEKNIGVLLKAISDSAGKIAAQESKVCPVCGQSLYKIKNSGQAGCPECYEIFKEEISQWKEKHHCQGTYTGTMPARLRQFKSVLNDRIALQNKLQAALDKEDYEKAAMYRDFLRALEKQSVADGEDHDSGK